MRKSSYIQKCILLGGFSWLALIFSPANAGEVKGGSDSIKTCDGTTCYVVTNYWSMDENGKITSWTESTSYPDPNADQEPPLEP